MPPVWNILPFLWGAGFQEKRFDIMQYDFTTIMDRRGKDAIAVDAPAETIQAMIFSQVRKFGKGLI